MPIKVREDEQTSINLTPMIDIVFLLIIFFMVGTKFSELNEQERDISLTVPKVSEAKAMTAPPSHRIVNVYADGRIELDQQNVSLKELEHELARARKQYPKLGVVVRGDANTSYQNVASVLFTCSKAEISDLNIRVMDVILR